MLCFNPAEIKVIGFDADDTLWVNEPYYRKTEEHFCELLQTYAPEEEIRHILYETELANLGLYGYGNKAFVLSLIETAIKVSSGRVAAENILRIIESGKMQIEQKNTLLPGVPEVLRILSGHYRLILATKGDLLDQERKLEHSGIAGYFHHIEIMTEKKEKNYQKLLNHLDMDAGRFLMIGNSVKSDVLPVLNLGGHAIHIPFPVTWQYEAVPDEEIPGGRFVSVDNLWQVLPVLGYGV